MKFQIDRHSLRLKMSANIALEAEYLKCGMFLTCAAVAVVTYFCCLRLVSKVVLINILDIDPLNIQLFSQRFSSPWSISHFALFTLVGYLFPNSVWIAFSLGVVWEAIEFAIEQFFFYMVPGARQQMQTNIIDKHYRGSWWAMSATDIVFNLMGLITGLLIASFCV